MGTWIVAMIGRADAFWWQFGMAGIEQKPLFCFSVW